ncbi:hypothetical protein E7Z59_13470 [Robertkochia marina]|uniref:Peptide O-xylosyltransferase n=1 Tax=Robertkochia marina TaxID=1227945 RepID=A0A4S3LYW8_9FLAO|nr:beta-1,6-N-acetylglucosaminyltransferase [Robertkochia marina]THD66782.1 hypothetical protein E7Z59_13470 [Robertkochia marina]TRZ41927.1 hypothetical protein D3A96_12610 [Robertkochia marina]
MRLNYLIFAHKNPEQLKIMIGALNGDDTYCYVHIDQSSDITEFKNSLSTLSPKNGVIFLNGIERHNIKWGDDSFIKAQIDTLNYLRRKCKIEGRFILLSGQCLPLLTNVEIKKYFNDHENIEFIDQIPLPNEIGMWGKFKGLNRVRFNAYRTNTNNRDYTLIPSIRDIYFYRDNYLKSLVKAVLYSPVQLNKLFFKRSFPRNLKFYGGEGWWALTHGCIDKILLFLDQNPGVIKALKYSFVPEEILFQSIVGTLIPFENIHKTLTYTNWNRPNVPHPVTFINEDLIELKAQDALFARKFDLNLDKEIFYSLLKIKPEYTSE